MYLCVITQGFTAEGKDTLFGVFTTKFITEKTISSVKDSFSLIVLSVLLLSLTVE